MSFPSAHVTDNYACRIIPRTCINQSNLLTYKMKFTNAIVFVLDLESNENVISS